MAQAESKITSVTLYPNGAELVREGDVLAPAGENVLTLANLTSFDAQSVSVKLQAEEDSGVAMLEVIQQANILPPSTNDFSELQHAVALKSQQVDDLTRQRGILLKYQDAIVNTERLKVQSFESWNKDFQAANDSVKTLDTNLLQATKYLELLKAKLATIETSAQQGSIQNGTLIQARVTANASATLHYILKYWVDTASWKPNYLAYATSKGELNVTYQGLIQQLTGENWTNVKLKLCTGNPTHNLYVAKLMPLYLQDFSPRYQNNSMMADGFMAAGSSSGSSANYSPSLKGASAPVREAVATVAQTTLAVMYELEQPANIASGQDWHKVQIAKSKLGAHAYYEITPSLSLQAIYHMTATNTTLLDFLPGDCSVFLDDGYVGTTTLAASPKEQFGLSLGVDDRIKVTYLVKPDYKEKNLIGTTLTRTVDATTTIKNQTPYVQEIKVLQQLPVSRNEKIVVSVQTPENLKTDSSGLFDTVLPLMTGKQTVLNLKYTIAQPVSLNVIETH